MKNKLIHLDCTLRDGGYYNNWNFDKNSLMYLLSMHKLKIDYVEVDLDLMTKKLKGPTAYSEKFING